MALGTMSGTDVAVFRLAMNVNELEALGVLPLPLSRAPARAEEMT